MICKKKKNNRRENAIIGIFKQDFYKKYENMQYRICLNIKLYILKLIYKLCNIVKKKN